MSVIKDGTGSGKLAKVNSDNKLETVTISTDIQQDASINKQLFRISTPVITLTSANNSTLLYVRNDDPNNNLIVPNIIISVGNSTGNTGDLVTSIGRANVTGGTIVSTATPASLIPLNLTVTTAPAIVAYSGVEGSTATYALDIPSYAAFPQESFTSNPFFITVAPGNNFVIQITPPAGNTSMQAQVTARGYLQPVEV